MRLSILLLGTLPLLPQTALAQALPQIDESAFYQLRNFAFAQSGQDLCTDIVNGGSQDNQLMTAPCGNYTGQFWKFSGVQTEYRELATYRMTTQFRGEDMCLTVQGSLDLHEVLLTPCTDPADPSQTFAVMPTKGPNTRIDDPGPVVGWTIQPMLEFDTASEENFLGVGDPVMGVGVPWIADFNENMPGYYWSLTAEGASAPLTDGSAGGAGAGVINLSGLPDNSQTGPFRLLAYSVNDGQRDAGGALTGYFVDASAGIVQSEAGAVLLTAYASGGDTVVFAVEGPSGPGFLSADVSGVSFAPAPTDNSYFYQRTALETAGSAQGFVSFESATLPGLFLRHEGYKLRLTAMDAQSSSLARRDATFLALADGTDFRGFLGVGTSVSTFSMASHFAAMARVDLAACGVHDGGGGGFGDRRVRTNSHGDVHIFTPDGLTYDFQAGGEFVLVASEDGSVAVHTRQTVHEEDPSVSSNTAVAFQVGSDVVEFYSDKAGQRLYVNGEATAMPGAELSLPGGGAIVPDGEGSSGPRFLVYWEGEVFTARVNLYEAFLNVGVDAAEGGRYSGLIGDLDGNPDNDMLPRDGTALICAPASVDQLLAFGDSWRLTSEETLLRAELKASKVVLVTDVSSGQRLSIETAISQTIQQNFAALEAGSSIDIATLILTVTALYEVDAAVVETALAVYLGQEITETTTSVSVETLTTRVETFYASMERATIETLDVKARAGAQRICEAGGVTDELALVNCVLDVVATQDETFVESATGFQASLEGFALEARKDATSFNAVLEPAAVLPREQVIELVGPPEVVPDITTYFVQFAEQEDSFVTRVTSDISYTVNETACTEVEGLPSPYDLLQEQPSAGGVSIYCATHARGTTITVQLGRTLEEARGYAADSCPAEAEARIEKNGEVVIACREIGFGERSFNFGGGVLSVGRDVVLTYTERLIEKPEVPEGLSLVFDPVPAITADCLGERSIPLDGITVLEGLLSYAEEAESDFQNLCSKVEMVETEEDYLLQATCFTEDASDVKTSAMTLLGVAAMLALVEDQSCQPEPEPEPEPGPEPEPAAEEPGSRPVPEGFSRFSEEGLEYDIPGCGDFLLIQNIEHQIRAVGRRTPWVSDISKPVYTALRIDVGSDVLEIYAAPTAQVLINGQPVDSPDAGVAVEGNMILLPGGGEVTVEIDEANPAVQALVVQWPEEAETTFALRAAVFPGSHLSPEVLRDPELEFEGLLRFTEDWLIEEAGVFSESFPDANCEACGN